MSKTVYKKLLNENDCDERTYLSNEVIKFEPEDDANNLRLKYGNSKTFNKYKLEYLVNPIMYRFNQGVRLKNMKNGIKILDIQEEDAKIVTQIIRRLHAGIRLRKNDTFVSKMHAVFVGYNGEYLDPSLLDGKNFQIDLEIEGYKLNEKGFPSPILSLVYARYSCDCL